VLGHTPGDDFYLANYEEAVKYFHVLAASTDRMKMFTVGKTTQGRDIEVAVISSPENLARLDEYKKTARQLATADGLNDEMIIHSEVLHDKISALQVSYGRGRILLYGFKPQQRGQAHGTYRYLFNALYLYDDPPLPSEPPSAAPAVTTAATAPATPAPQQPAAARRRSGGTQP
jgi:hypothetical protein